MQRAAAIRTAAGRRMVIIALGNLDKRSNEAEAMVVVVVVVVAVAVMSCHPWTRQLGVHDSLREV